MELIYIEFVRIDGAWHPFISNDFVTRHVPKARSRKT
jgi:hypothetical protein